jgi:hypothetical protein
MMATEDVKTIEETLDAGFPAPLDQVLVPLLIAFDCH